MLKLRRFSAHIALGCATLMATTFAAADLRFTEYVEGSSNNKALEIYNDTGAPVNLAGFEVRMYFNGSSGPGNTILLSGTVANDDVFVLANASADSAVLVVADQTDANSWFNGDDAVELVDNTALVIDVIGQIGFDPGSEWGAGLVSTANNTLRRKESVTTADTNGSDAFDPAMEWDGFDQNTFDGLGFFPGTGGGGDPLPLAIYEIQGAGHTSPVAGMQVVTTGIVVAVDSNGFYLQDPTGDGNTDTSDGIFVFTSSAPTVTTGDNVEVTGSVSEFIPGGVQTGNLAITEITGPSVVINSSGNTLPAAAIIGSSGRMPPTEIIDNDNFALFDPAEDGIDFYETVEGMRVTVEDAVAASVTNRFGETVVLNNQGQFATGRNSRGGITLTENDFNPERIQLQYDNDLVPGFSPGIGPGDLLGNVTGVVGYGFGNFEVRLTSDFKPNAAGLTEEITSLSSDSGRVTIATHNVLNLEVNPDDDDDDIGSGRFAALGSQIVDNMQAPDIIALQEIQDNDGSFDTGVVAADLVYLELINAIATAGGPTYDFVDLPPVNNQDGGQPGGNIRNGYLYQPARVDLIGVSRVLDPDLGDGDAFANSRKPLYGEFDFDGTRLHLVNVHFRSKGGGTPLFGAIQPAVNGGVEAREAQAQVVNDFVDDLLAGGDENVIVLGDVNEWTFETPLQLLKGEPAPVLQNLSETIPAIEDYSFVFDGNASPLDHILVSNTLADGAEFDIVHANSEFVSPATDHDPAIVRLSLAADTDNDGIADNEDNCLSVDNFDQRDTDSDNIGNACDADVAQPNDCQINLQDLAVYRQNFLANGDLDTDNNGDGVTNLIDLAIVRSFFLQPPGPSAAGCN